MREKLIHEVENSKFSNLCRPWKKSIAHFSGSNREHKRDKSSCWHEYNSKSQSSYQSKHVPVSKDPFRRYNQLIFESLKTYWLLECFPPEQKNFTNN